MASFAEKLKKIKDDRKPKDGYTPVKGKDYFDGKDGHTPIKGEDYFDGIDGKDGEQGPKGDKGDPGNDGLNGKNGKSVDEAKIIKKVLQKIPKQIQVDLDPFKLKLKTSHIEGLEQTLSALRSQTRPGLGYVHGGGASLLSQLGDVLLTNLTSGDVLTFNGTKWINSTFEDDGIISLNGLSGIIQTFAVGTTGTDFNIDSTGTVHTFNLPTASHTNRGALSSSDWDTFNSKQVAGNYITALTGDVSASGPGSAATTLATVNGNVGTFGSATQSVQFTVNGKGLITSAANVTITPAASSITGAGDLTKGDDTNVTLTLGGTPTGALLKSTSITAGWSGQLSLSRGGTAANLSDPGGDRLWGWDDTDNSIGFWIIGTGLSYDHATHTISSPDAGGTVTTVSVVTANGISGSVANATTTPAITLTLGAITPTTVNGITLSGSGSLANSGTSSLTGFSGSGTSSGTNTGDQTNITGNAGTVTVAAETTDTTCSIGFFTDVSGSLAPKTNTNITFNSNTGVATFGQTIVGSVNGNAATATALQNARNIGGVSFNGTANITVASATGGFTVSGGNLTVSAIDIATDTTTGTKFGTATNQKISFYNSTPIVQPSGDVTAALTNLGLVATPTILADTVKSTNEATDTSCFPLFITASGTQSLATKNNANFIYNSNSNSLTATTFIGALTGNASTVTTNANLTGPITSVGNATSIASQTGTGTKFVVDTSPTIITPTFTTSATGPLFIGGTGTTSTLILRSTSGSGTTGADIIFQSGTNGGVETMRILNNGDVGVGTATPNFGGYAGHTLTVFGGGTAVPVFEGIRNTSTGGTLNFLFRGGNNTVPALAGVAIFTGTNNNDGEVHLQTSNAGASPADGLIQDSLQRVGIGVASGSITAFLHLKAGAATANNGAPLKFNSGTNLTTAEAGAMEYDGKVIYSTPVAGARGVSPSTMYSIVAAGGFALSTAAGVQSCFASTGDVWTLAASTTYIVEGHYAIQQATNNVTVAMAFALGGGASVTSIRYFVWEFNAGDNTITASPTALGEVTQVASTVVSVTSITNKNIFFKGIIRMNAGGTVTPQINFSGTAAGTPTMLAGSYIMFTPIGTNTNNILGAVA